MKKPFTLFALLFISMISMAQNNVNLIIFSEDLEPFYAYVNGIRQNNKPETNVRIAGVSPNIALRIEFENKALPVIKQNMALEPGFEHTARLKKDKNMVMKLRYFGQVPMEQAQPTNAVSTVNYHTSETPLETNTSVNSTNNSVNTSVGAGGVNSNVSITSSTTTTQVNNSKDNSQMNVTMPGININMTVTDPNMTQNTSTTTSRTITTTHSSSGSYMQETQPANTSKPATSPAPVNAAPANAGCSVAMSPASFNKMKQTVESKPFSDTKMSTAKVATKNNCLSVAQVMEIAKLFSMDDDKLEYAKYAYNYCTEKGNYYQVSEIFSFSSTTDELNKFLDK